MDVVVVCVLLVLYGVLNLLLCQPFVAFSPFTFTTGRSRDLSSTTRKRRHPVGHCFGAAAEVGCFFRRHMPGTTHLTSLSKLPERFSKQLIPLP